MKDRKEITAPNLVQAITKNDKYDKNGTNDVRWRGRHRQMESRVHNHVAILYDCMTV